MHDEVEPENQLRRSSQLPYQEEIDHCNMQEVKLGTIVFQNQLMEVYVIGYQLRFVKGI